MTGTVTIPAGTTTFSVSGLQLPAVPARLVVCVRKPAGGRNLLAQVVDGSAGADGFEVALSGPAEGANHRLDWFAAFA